MSVWSLLHHRPRAYWCVPFRGRRLASLLIIAFIALYFGGSLVLAGVFFDDLVREVAPTADPLLVAAKGLLPFGLGYAAIRLVIASGLGVDPRPYQVLPVHRSVLVSLLSVFTLFSLWNAVPLTFVGAVCVERAMSGGGLAAFRFGLAGLGVLVAVTYAVPMLRRAVSGRPFVALGLVGLLVAATALEAVDVGAGLVSLLDVSGWLFGGVVRGQILPATVAMIGLVGLVGGYARWLRRMMVVDRSQPRAASGGPSVWLSRLARRGPAWREAVLEGRLLWRNPQTRMALFTTSIFLITVIAFAFFPMKQADLREISGLQLLNLTLFPGLFATGGAAIYYGQNLFGWEGHCFEATMARPISSRTRVTGKLLFLEAGTLACFLIPLPFLLIRQSPFVIVHTSFFLYNAGVVAPAVIAGATFNRKALAIDELSFGQTNFSAERTAIMIPLFGIPFLPLFLFDRLILQFGGIAGFGLLSLFAMPLWLRGLTRVYEYNRYAMLEGFQAFRGNEG